MYHSFIFDYKASDDKALLAYLSVQIKCEDASIYSEDGAGGFSIYLSDSYICLNMDIESKRISGICGELIAKKIKTKRITPPDKYQTGILALVNDGDYSAGCGTRICFENRVFYDKRNRLLQLGSILQERRYVRFLHNAYAQLDEKNHLQGILITDIDV